MNYRKAFISSTIALSCYAAAAFADAKADENPYTPEPAASTETADHGQGTYCSTRPLGAFWSCEAPDMSSNGYGEGDKTGLPDREGKHIVHEVKKI